MASSLNTLQRRELFSLSLFNCKCFSTSSLSSLHNSFAVSSTKHFLPLKLSPLNLIRTPLTVKTPVTDTILYCNYSTKTVDFSNSNGILNSGFSSSGAEEEGRTGKGFLGDGKKSRKNGESFDFREKGENERGVSGDGRKIRKNGESFDFGKKGENESGVLGDARKIRKNGESFDFGRKGEIERGVLGDDRKGRENGESFDFGKKGANESRFLGNGRKGGKNGESFGFEKKGENGGEVSSFRKGGSRSIERKKKEILGKVGVYSKSDVRKDQNVARNKGHKGPWFASKRVKEANSASVVVDRGAVKNDANKVKKEKVSKKKNPNSPQVRMRIGLDMCSKKGDVMGAISLYDSFVKEGAKLAQYHYTVLLYLCSSAAMGVVQPAKSGSGSGSGSRSLGTVAPQNADETGDSAEEEDDDSDDCDDEALNMKDQAQKIEVNEIRVSDEVKKYARERGFEIYEKMCLEKVQMNEAALTSVARMAMAMGDGDMAFDVVKQMKSMGISPKLRSYGPALSVFTSNGEIEKAFAVEEHMLENGVDPEEPELEALLRVSVEAGKADRVYYVLHKLRTNVRSVSPNCADLIEKWFKSIEASRIGKRKWDHDVIAQTMENVGGGWHGKGWLGSGKWCVSRTSVGADGLCKCCGEKLALIDLDPKETEEFAESVAAIATKRERNSSFQKFQRWLDYYGPFEAVVDAANVGIFGQRFFRPLKVNAVVNGIRQMNPSRKWPLIVLHNKRVTRGTIDKPAHKEVFEKWKNADALYATPTGSNDDWYWLYAAIRFKCLLVTNDEMRDHTFQLLGNDFFPKWKERHQVRFSFSETGPVFHMPPPCSVVIQESESGHWHIPIASDHQSEEMRTWLCVTRPKSLVRNQRNRVDGADSAEDSEEDIENEKQAGSSKSHSSHQVKAAHSKLEANEIESVRHRHLKNMNLQSSSSKPDHLVILKALKTAEEHAGRVIDFQI